MFAGIVAAVGRVGAVTQAPGGVRLRVDAGSLELADVSTGDSIAVNGVCLTVVARAAGTFDVDVSRETLGCTKGFGAGERVNLEKALRASERIGGHLVSGHVDGVGTVVRFEAAGDSRLLAITAPRELAKYIARKGSIAVDGVSLTINAVNGPEFAVNLIPYTLAATTLGELAAGSRVNLEVDVLARYVERLRETGAH